MSLICTAQHLFDRLERPSNGEMRSALAIMQELQQAFYIDSIDWTASNGSGLWEMCVAVRLWTGPVITSSGQAARQKSAKHDAATKAYPAIKNRESSLYVDLRRFALTSIRHIVCLSAPPPTPEHKDQCRLQRSRQPKTCRQAKILHDAGEELAKLQQLAEQDVHLIAVDVEAYEKDKNVILEIGMASVYLPTSDIITCEHLVVEDNLDVRNGSFVPDHKDHYNFGQSVKVPAESIGSVVSKWVAALPTEGAMSVLVGHSLNGDLRWLEGMGIQFDCGHTCDVAMVQQALTQDHERVKLERLAEMYGVDGTNWHNAGNDARYTLELALKMIPRVRQRDTSS